MKSCFALAACLLPFSLPANAQGQPDIPDSGITASDPEEIEFSADTINYDFENDVVVARGNVELAREGYRLRADNVTWNRKTGRVTAEGDVRTTGPDGDIVYSNTITLTDSLRDGMVENLLLVLEDGGRLAALKGERFDDGSMALDIAAYTACAVTTEEGCPKEPSWQIKAVKVRYDPIKKRVSYDGARIEIFGLPVIPLPGLSHPISNENRSGILVPNLRIDSTNGVAVSLPYYFNIAPNQDATVTAQVFTEVAPLVSGTFRHLDDKGAFQITGYATYSSRIPTGATGPLPNAEKDFRGYFETSGRFKLGNNWTVSQSARLVSDRTFLRRYDISDDDSLRSTINLERIDNSSYFSLAGWAFQTLRTSDPQNQVPIVLPMVDYRKRLSDPVLGGQAMLQFNSLAIERTGGQDTQRAFASARWDLRRLTKTGQEITFTAYARGDVYHSDDNVQNPVTVYQGNSGWEARGIVSAAVDIKWPFIGKAFGGTQTITPRFQIVATPNLANLSLPNEDSRAVDLEDTNLFSLNRFPGYDRYEDNVRASYGVEWNLVRPNLSINTIVGQSYRLENNNNIVPEGTGLSDRFSDIVGRSNVRFKDIVKFTHRFRLDKDNLAVRRNEIDLTVGSKSTYVQAGYLRLNRDIGAELEDLRDREEIRIGGRYQIDKYWSVFGSAIVDLTDEREDPTSSADGFEPVRHRLGVAYDDGCLSLGVTWRYDYEDTGDAERGSTFLFRLALRNLGV
ncbi:LPS-assembly protein [Parasphingorhabdus marina DSM 22363]|uniref:LPS-assembly protein LptD n=1 Tax=Parasphingorhabdus marina DSM 22363 TaxID=1123272 RepID=A0A1N6GHV8_9SPHN|nr:LPS assembly protein LptD [Parasphingorhabdus marina]SIO07130.1 LPS-assembly protein [Parasphingorhabdus marina DSM 22363]